MRLMKEVFFSTPPPAVAGDTNAAISSVAPDIDEERAVIAPSGSKMSRTHVGEITSPHIVWPELDKHGLPRVDSIDSPMTAFERPVAEGGTELTRDGLFQSAIETEMLLLERDLQDVQQVPPDTVLNVARLAAVIELVDASAQMQGIALSLADKSQIIAALYAEGLGELSPPSSIRADRMVWLSGS